VEKSAGAKLLKIVATAEPIARKLREIERGVGPVSFSHVITSAQPFLAAVIAGEVEKTIWVVCPSVHAQETLYESLLNWRSDALFLPEAEFAAVENILPDPEIAAERLALLSKIERQPGPHLIVATRAALEHPAPKRGALNAATVSLQRGNRMMMERIINSVGGAQYERVAQVSTRGQFAVRGGILDIYSWQAQLPVRIEFFADEIESIREFDLDTQTSIRELESVDILLGTTPNQDAALPLSSQGAAVSGPPGRSRHRPSLKEDSLGRVRDYIARDHCLIAIEPEKDEPAQIKISEGWLGGTTSVSSPPKSPDATERVPAEDFSGAFVECDVGEFAVGDFIVAEAKRAQFAGRLKEWRDSGARIVIYFQTEGEVERFREIIGDASLQGVELEEGTLAHGFCFPDGNLVVLSAAALFGRVPAHGRRRLQRAERLGRNRAQIDFSELNEGDLVVHLEHGVGRFLGLQKMSLGPVRAVEAGVAATPEPAEGVSPANLAVEAGVSPATFTTTAATTTEVLALEFADEAKLYVPLEQAYLVSRYVGVGKKSPALASLADGKWSRAKSRAAASVFDYAGKMLAVQAERETQTGHAFGPDTKWQAEFEHSFPFRETPDQLKAIIETKKDMELARSMDRLICGDVGFGKTEVAIRAAFKAVMDGKQVAVLTPTTVLAQQHFETFRQRMLDYPVRIEMLSRFRSQGEQRKVLQLLREGGVDVVIGTHRLISGDVVFKDLGLVIIDEEQRFGVLHKEKFKELFKLVDVLTLSATPIPRTLYLSLVGVKDMSAIETPPLNRLPVETVVCGYDERIIRDAINRELDRQGQVYFLHNRVQTIERTRDRIAELCPKARIEFGHGQMDDDELENVMARFVAGKIDVLVCTTIIESGLDIPNANTIIIDRADRFGLADLYQLRGRVGRAEHKAYAYLMLPREMMTVGAARKRINAIKQYSSLGAGFRIAMRDLEIRGAGSILGTAQSGHIMAIGFDLYCQLLKQAVAQLKGQKFRPRLEVQTRIDFVSTNEAEYLSADPQTHVPAFVPGNYVADTALRIAAYRQLAEVTTEEQLQHLARDWRDRFGKFPLAVDNLLLLTEIRLAAAKAGIQRVEVREDKVMLTRRGEFILVAGKFPRISSVTIDQHLGEILALLRKL
jgi:transcription-repair coupling factor (superfamily II helicase)